MPKMKSNSGAKKRFRFTASGKPKHAKANHSHILTKKPMKRKRRLRGSTLADSTNVKHIKRMVPYGG